MRSLPIEAAGDGVCVIEVGGPDAHHLDSAFVEAFSSTAARVAEMADLRVVILRANGNYFSAGASREALLGAADGAPLSRYTRELPLLVLRIPAFTIAAMEGHAIGGGLLLGLWCDLPLLATESLYGANFMTLGFTPGMGSTLALERHFGASLARELMFTGRVLKGREIRDAGVPISRNVIPAREVLEHALDVAAEVASAPRVSVALLKRTLAARDERLLELALAEEREMHAQLFGSDTVRRRILHDYGSAMSCEPDGGETA
jgi:enoyl-CoA hydratase/carnithine racemase